MVEEPVQDVALLSLHPEYADAIIDGTKRVEFRRVVPTRSIRGVAIYATAPIQRIVGYFDVDEVETEPPTKLWERWHQAAGITRSAYDKYFSGCDVGHAIHVGDVTALAKPMALLDLSPNLTPPQSFVYLQSDARETLRVALQQ